MNRRFRIGWLFLLSLSAFVLFLSGPDIVTSHEARVALPARVMAASGWPWKAHRASVPAVKLQPGVVRLVPDFTAPPIAVNPWLVPVLNGQIRLQKPPLPYWCAAIAFRVTGRFSETALRLAPALLGMLAAFLMYDLGRMLYGRRIAWLAALAWVSTYAIPEQYRKAMADPYLAFFTLACVWSWVKAWRAGMETVGRWDGGTAGEENAAACRVVSPSRIVSPSHRLTVSPSLFLFIFYISFGFALLGKGPPAFVVILFPLVAFHLCFGAKPPRTLGMHALGIFLMLAVALPWPVYVWRSVPNAMEVWRYESVGEMADNTENARPWWFYLPQLFYLALPWTAMMLVGIARQIHRGIDHFSHSRPKRPRLHHFFPLLWYLGIVIFFSTVVHLKKNQYLLPALPAQSLLIAQGLAVVLAGARKLRVTGRAAVLLVFQTVLGIGFGIAVLIMMIRLTHPGSGDLALAALAVVAALLSVFSLILRRVRTWMNVQAAAFVLLTVVFIRCYLTPRESERSGKYVAAEMLALSRQPGWTLLPARLPEEVAVYLPADVQYNPVARHVLIVVDDQHGMRLRESRHLPMPAPQVEQFAGWIPDGRLIGARQIPLTSAPGDARWKVYELTVLRKWYAGTWSLQ